MRCRCPRPFEYDQQAMAGQPSVIGPYRVVRKLGGGGMGVVYQCIRDGQSTHVAVKVLRPQYAQDAELTRRMFNEARSANQIAHPGLVQISEFGQTPDGTSYLVMEFLSGPTLREYISGPPHPLPDVLEIARQIASALHAAHETGIVHRDLKPENVMLIDDSAARFGRRTKILDFGIAKRLQNTPELQTLTKTPEHRIMGTPAYMAPEQCLGAAGVDAKADVYSFGIMLYEMLAGETPFASEGRADVKMLSAHLTKPVPPLADRVPELPAAVAVSVLQCLTKDRAERPSIAAVLGDLEGFCQDPQIQALGALTRRRVIETGEPINPFSATMASDPTGLGTINPFSGTVATGPAQRRPRTTAEVPPLTAVAPRRSRPVGWIVAVVGVALLAGGGWAARKWTSETPGSAQPAHPSTLSAAEAAPTQPVAPAASVWTLHTEPVGADVLDEAGTVLGKTPFSQTVTPAALRLRVRQAGYVPVQVTLQESGPLVQRIVLQPDSSAANVKPAKRRAKSARPSEKGAARTPLFE